MKQLEALKNHTALKEVVKIYVPSTYDVDQEIDNEQYVKDIELGLVTLFGGTTTIKGNGSWSSSSGFIVSEEVDIVCAFTDKLNNEDIDGVLKLCEWLKNEMKQEAISLEVNNQLYFI